MSKEYTYRRDTHLLKQFGQRIRQLRQEKNMTMEDLAYQSGLDYSQISRIERGVTNPSLINIALVARALTVDLRNLFDQEWDLATLINQNE